MESSHQFTPLNCTVILRGLSIASVSLGFWSLVVFWWFPYSLMISSAGLALGLFCLLMKVRGIRGENYALVGTCFSFISLSVILTLTQGLHYLLWK